VEDGEETEQARPVEAGGGLRLEQEVEDRRAGGAEHDEQRDRLEVRELAERLEAQRSSRARADRRLGRRSERQRGAGRVQHREHEQLRSGREPYRHALGGQPAGNTAEGAGGGNAPVRATGRDRIERFGGQRPEAREQERSERGQMEIDDDRDGRCEGGLGPLGHVRGRAQQEAGRHEPGRAKAGQQLRVDRYGGDRHGGGRHHHERQARGGEDQQEE